MKEISETYSLKKWRLGNVQIIYASEVRIVTNLKEERDYMLPYPITSKESLIKG